MSPRIIPRKEHCISRKQISPNALRTLYRLHSRGFVAYLVGGCVRDLLLGRVPKDFDIGTNATPGQIKKLFRNCRLIGRRFRLAHLHFQGEIIEVSTFRRTALPSDSLETKGADQKSRPPRHAKSKDGMVLMDNVFGTAEEDALRRDFTINALAYNIADFSVIDYSTGLEDLEERLINPIGDPFVRFTEDPVRMLRAVRFAASHGFFIETSAWKTLSELSPIISRVSPARLYEEIQKLFLFGFSRRSFELLKEGGLLAALFPGFNHWAYEGGNAALEARLSGLDRQYEIHSPVSPTLFLTAVFGSGLEKSALIRRRDGIPHQQALETACAVLMEEICKTISVPKKVGVQTRAIVALQAPMRRVPPRRPSSIMGKPQFKDALAYLRLTAETDKEQKTAVEWWNAFLLDPRDLTVAEPSAEETPQKRRRRGRRKSRRRKNTDAPSGDKKPL